MTVLGSILRILTERPQQSAASGSVILGGTMGQQQGMQTQLQSMGGIGWLFAVVDRIATAVASTEWELYESPKKARQIERHPLLDVWQHPNPFMDRRYFVEAWQQHAELVGERWAPVVQVGRTIELWPTRPDRMRPVPSPTEYVAGFEYRIAGRVETLAATDVIWWRKPNPLDSYRGMGVVQSLLVDLQSERYAAEWLRSFFRNDARPGGVIEFSEKLSDTDYEDFITRYKAQHQGASNASRVAVLEGATWKDVKLSMRDMQLEQIRKLNRDTILGAFGIPASMLGIAENVNRANAEAAEVMFARWVVKPRLEELRNILNTQLVPRFGTGLYLDFVDPVPENREIDLEEAERGYLAGILTRNEARRLINQPDVAGGDDFKEAAPVVESDEMGEMGEMDGMKRLKGNPLLEPPEDVAELRMADGWEQRLSKELYALSYYLGAKTIRRDIQIDDVEGFDWAWWERYGDEVVAELADMFTLGAVTAEPGAAVPVLQVKAAAFARARGAELLQAQGEVNVVALTKRRVHELIAETLENGDSLQTLQKRLREDYAFSRQRAETIARTETAEALGAGRMEAALAQGRDEKRWVTQGIGSNVCPVCAANAAQGWIKAGASFQGGTLREPQHSRCRCVCSYRTAALYQDSARVEEARCPDCSKLLGKNVADGTLLWCERCRAEKRVTAEGAALKVLSIKRVERDDEGRLVRIIEEAL